MFIHQKAVAPAGCLTSGLFGSKTFGQKYPIYYKAALCCYFFVGCLYTCN